MKIRKTIWHAGKGYFRTRTKRGDYYFRKGKRISEKKFKKSVKRVARKIVKRVARKIVKRVARKTVKRVARKSVKRVARKIVKRVARKIVKRVARKIVKRGARKISPLILCRVRDREKLFERIKKDRHELQLTLGEDFDYVRILADIGTVKRNKKHARDLTNQGARYFPRLYKFKNFLGLNYRYPKSKRPDWTRKGICKYEKRMYLVKLKVRGERILSHKILKRYAIEEPF